MASGLDLIEVHEWEVLIRAALPDGKRDLVYHVDIASQDSRPENPMAMGKKQIHTYDPSTGVITKESMAELFAYIPSKIVKFRVFALDHDHDRLLASATEEVFQGAGR